MRLMSRRVSRDWQAQYGHPLFGLETFVDPQYFQGTCYKASGWRALGKTKGYGRSRKDFYQRHDRPKELYWRELNRKGLKQLARKNLPDRYQPFETDYRLCPWGAPALRSLYKLFAGVNDPRKRQGRRYPLQTLLTIIALATACGMKGHRAIASFASHLTTTQRRVLRCPKDKHTGEYRSPKERKTKLWRCAKYSTGCRRCAARSSPATPSTPNKNLPTPSCGKKGALSLVVER